MYLHVTTRDGISASSASSSSVSRAEPVDETTIADAGILAFNFRGNWTENLAPNFMHNVRISKASGWTTDYYYPNKSNVRFYAYSPYDCKGMVLPGKDEAGVPKIRYKVPESVAEQFDFMCAVSDDVSVTETIGNTSLVFRHALTAVRFVASDDIADGTIKSIAIKGVFDSGVCTLGNVPVWQIDNTTANFSQTLGKTIVGGADEPITAASQTFMMIPQTLPAGAVVEVVLNDGKEYTLSSSIAGAEWKAGQTNVYKISSSSITGEPVFVVTPPGAFEYNGGTKIYKVASYKLRTDGTKMAVPWSVTGYSTDGGATWSKTRPDWLSLVDSGAGNDYEVQLSATVKAQSPDISHYEKLSQATPVTGVYDLSTNGGTTPANTANCYVINAAGKYSLPLVYGNGLKNGATNAAAYTSSVTGEYILANLPNHLGATITSPYIYENAGCKPTDAVLVWEDKYGLITDIELSADRHSLVFEVPQAGIDQGNAVIAVRDAGKNIMWSWHIWVTDYRLGDDVTVTNAGGVQYEFMPINLGWCYSVDAESYQARKVLVKFAQNGGRGLEQIVAFIQSAHVGSVAGGSTYYQWGRKDPLPPADGLGGDVGKTYYDAMGNDLKEIPYSGKWGDKVNTIIGCILNPCTFCSQTEMNQLYDNLWSVDNNFNPDEIVIKKTIYDPSPVGYCVPPMAAFNSLSRNNVKGEWDTGWCFYCDAAKQNTIFMPAVGYRTENVHNIDYGRLTAVGFHAYYAASTPYKLISSNERYAGCFYVFRSKVEVTNRFRMTGMSVRCAREK